MESRLAPNPTTILFLAANPLATSRLQLDEEARRVRNELQKASLRDQIRLETRWAVRLGDIFDALNEVRPRVVHFSGHGSEVEEVAGISILDEFGEERVLSSEKLRSLFQTFGATIRAVVLNCCYSEPQARAIAQVVDFTIGMSEAIDDESAIDFSGQLYSALAFGRTVGQAFEQAILRLKMDDRLGHTAPRLLSRRGSDNEAFLAPFEDKSSEAGEKASRRARQGRRCLEQGLFAEASQHLKATLELDPSDHESRYYLVLSALAGRRPKLLRQSLIRKIESHLEAAIAEDPQPRYYLLWAIVKNDFYTLNGFAEGRPSITELLEGGRRVTSTQLAEIVRFVVTADGFVSNTLRHAFGPERPNPKDNHRDE